MNRPEGLARHPVEDVQKSHLRTLGDGIDPAPTVRDREQRGRGRQIHVPEIVMDELLMPDPASGIRVQGNDAIGKEILTIPLTTPEVRAGGFGGVENNSSLRVER